MQFRHQRGPTSELLRTAPVSYIVFDLLQLGDEVWLAAPYTRRALLADLPVTGPPRRQWRWTATKPHSHAAWRGWTTWSGCSS
jgi:ATP-dependent DNA ligase